MYSYSLSPSSLPPRTVFLLHMLSFLVILFLSHTIFLNHIDGDSIALPFSHTFVLLSRPCRNDSDAKCSSNFGDFYYHMLLLFWEGCLNLRLR